MQLGTERSKKEERKEQLRLQRLAENATKEEKEERRKQKHLHQQRLKAIEANKGVLELLSHKVTADAETSEERIATFLKLSEIDDKGLQAATANEINLGGSLDDSLDAMLAAARNAGSWRVNRADAVLLPAQDRAQQGIGLEGFPDRLSSILPSRLPSQVTQIYKLLQPSEADPSERFKQVLDGTVNKYAGPLPLQPPSASDSQDLEDLLGRLNTTSKDTTCMRHAAGSSEAAGNFVRRILIEAEAATGASDSISWLGLLKNRWSQHASLADTHAHILIDLRLHASQLKGELSANLWDAACQHLAKQDKLDSYTLQLLDAYADLGKYNPAEGHTDTRGLGCLYPRHPVHFEDMYANNGEQAAPFARQTQANLWHKLMGAEQQKGRWLIEYHAAQTKGASDLQLAALRRMLAVIEMGASKPLSSTPMEVLLQQAVLNDSLWVHCQGTPDHWAPETSPDMPDDSCRASAAEQLAHELLDALSFMQQERILGSCLLQAVCEQLRGFLLGPEARPVPRHWQEQPEEALKLLPLMWLKAGADDQLRVVLRFVYGHMGFCSFQSEVYRAALYRYLQEDSSVCRTVDGAIHLTRAGYEKLHERAVERHVQNVIGTGQGGQLLPVWHRDPGCWEAVQAVLEEVVISTTTPLASGVVWKQAHVEAQIEQMAKLLQHASHIVVTRYLEASQNVESLKDSVKLLQTLSLQPDIMLSQPDAVAAIHLLVQRIRGAQTWLFQVRVQCARWQIQCNLKKVEVRIQLCDSLSRMVSTCEAPQAIATDEQKAECNMYKSAFSPNHREELNMRHGKLTHKSKELLPLGTPLSSQAASHLRTVQEHAEAWQQLSQRDSQSQVHKLMQDWALQIEPFLYSSLFDLLEALMRVEDQSVIDMEAAQLHSWQCIRAVQFGCLWDISEPVSDILARALVRQVADKVREREKEQAERAELASREMMEQLMKDEQEQQAAAPKKRAEKNAKKKAKLKAKAAAVHEPALPAEGANVSSAAAGAEGAHNGGAKPEVNLPAAAAPSPARSCAGPVENAERHAVNGEVLPPDDDVDGFQQAPARRRRTPKDASGKAESLQPAPSGPPQPPDEFLEAQRERMRLASRLQCDICRQAGHIKQDCPRQQCRSCYQHGHISSICPFSDAEKSASRLAISPPPAAAKAHPPSPVRSAPVPVAHPGQASAGSAASTAGRRTGPTPSPASGRGSSGSSSRSQPRPQHGNGPAADMCRICGRPGHTATTCPRSRAQRPGSGGGQSDWGVGSPAQSSSRPRILEVHRSTGRPIVGEAAPVAPPWPSSGEIHAAGPSPSYGIRRPPSIDAWQQGPAQPPIPLPPHSQAPDMQAAWAQRLLPVPQTPNGVPHAWPPQQQAAPPSASMESYAQPGGLHSAPTHYAAQQAMPSMSDLNMDWSDVMPPGGFPGPWEPSTSPDGAPAGPPHRPEAGKPPPEEDDLMSSMLRDLGCADQPGGEASAPPLPKAWGVSTADGEEAAPSAWGPRPGEAHVSPTQQQEEDDLQAAIQASLQETGGRPADGAGERAVVVSGDIAVPGLQNEAGEYNCFLNVIIQCLWQSEDFRTQLLHLPEEVVEGDAVVEATVGLFHAFAAQKPAGAGASSAAAMQERSVVAPTQLREALSALNQEFEMGKMSDASEVLFTLYDSINGACEEAGLPSIVDATFGLSMREMARCGACGLDTHRTQYTQYFYNVTATALRMAHLVSDGAPLGRKLREIDHQQMKSCDTDEGGCGTMNHLRYELAAVPPRVFTLQLAWESSQEASQDIADTVGAIDEELDLAAIYQDLPSMEHMYKLRSMVCFYGAHYQAFILMPDGNQWALFDDASAYTVGNWGDVVYKCQKGRIQPSVLFFAA